MKKTQAYDVLRNLVKISQPAKYVGSKARVFPRYSAASQTRGHMFAIQDQERLPEGSGRIGRSFKSNGSFQSNKWENVLRIKTIWKINRKK